MSIIPELFFRVFIVKEVLIQFTGKVYIIEQNYTRKIILSFDDQTTQFPVIFAFVITINNKSQFIMTNIQWLYVILLQLPVFIYSLYYNISYSQLF